MKSIFIEFEFWRQRLMYRSYTNDDWQFVYAHIFLPAPICRSCQSHYGTARSNRSNQECGPRPRQLELPKNEKDPYE